MPEPPINGMHEADSDRRDADRLSAAWNALVLGETAVTEPLQPGDAEVIRKLDALAPMPVPSRTFVRNLREDLMDASIVAPAQPLPTRSSRLTALVPSSGGRAPSDRGWLVATRQSLSTAATIAMVAVTLLGSALAVVWQQGGGGGEQDEPVSLAAQTAAAQVQYCVDCPQFIEDVGSVRYLGRGIAPPIDATEADLAATNAQLQHWILDPGAQIEMDDATSGVHGAVVDIVLQGVAIVTVDTPAIVHRGRFTHKATYEYPLAGEPVELVRGDSISYAAGRAKTVTNPLTTIPMQLKSAVFYIGDVTLTRPADGTSDGRQIRVDGDGLLSQPLSRETYGGGFDVLLEYVELFPGTDELEPDVFGLSGTVVIGPVDPLQPPGGYILRLAPTMG